MDVSLFDRLANFLMPSEAGKQPKQDGKVYTPRFRERRGADLEQTTDNKPPFIVHSQSSSVFLKISVEEATSFDDAQKYADYLKSNRLVLVNYQYVNPSVQQRICDFLNGTCYAIDGTVQQVSERVMLYACANVEIDKKLFAYFVPTYVRVKLDEQ